ncbi:hypothetical protein [Paenibacillus sp. NPDC055715]
MQQEANTIAEKTLAKMHRLQADVGGFSTDIQIEDYGSCTRLKTSFGWVPKNL